VELELSLELDGLLLLGELKLELEFSLPPASTWMPLVDGEDGDIVALLAATVTWLTREEDKGMFCFFMRLDMTGPESRGSVNCVVRLLWST
jgi:hypothetical protein